MDPCSTEASLLNCFRQAPPSVIPPLLDCILASTISSPSSLLSSLLSNFPIFMKEITEGSENIDQQRISGVGSYVSALCHLLKKSGASVSDLDVFIWSVLIPILKWAHGSHLQVFNEVVSMFVDVLVEKSCWNAVEEIMFPFIFRLIGLSMGLIQSGESAIYEWSSCLNLELSGDHPGYVKFLRCPNDKLTDAVRRDPSPSHSGFFPLSVSCYILTSILDALVHYKNTADHSCGSGVANGCRLETLTGTLVWDLCNLTFQMLAQSAEHRSSAVRILLPSIFEAFASYSTFEVLVHEKTHALSRELLVNNLWASCKKLFSLGLSERRDAYAVLSLCLASPFSSESKEGNMDSNRTISDFTAYKEFWDELKRGLVDKENLVRKKSLHILKIVLSISQESISSDGVSEVESDEKSLAPPSLTKRERWAYKEATSLGVGRIYKFTDHNSQKTWEAFILLYEMLEEYGTHLVEAAWNHQMNLLIHSFPAHEDLDHPVNSNYGELPQTSMRTFQEICGWLAVLWERGFSHDNPQVRCLIMQSFLVIEWMDYGNCAKLVPEEFILGPLMKGLNDPVHHKEFGLKGVYSSWTIDAASKFFLQYGSSLDVRYQTEFLCHLTRLSIQYSFGRPGLMCLAECIASAAHGIKILKNSTVKQFSDVTSDMLTVNLSLENSAQNEKTFLLDTFRFIIESTKQHFNANYRFQVCEKILDAAASAVSASNMPLVNILHFISNLPREFTDTGLVRFKVQNWLLNDEKQFNSSCSSQSLGFLPTLIDFPRKFVCLPHPFNANVTYDDDDVDLWQTEADRWARVTFLVNEDQHLETVYSFIQDYGSNIIKENNQLSWIPVKFLTLVSSLVQELQVIQSRMAEDPFPRSVKAEHDLPVDESHDKLVKHATFLNFAQSFLSVADVIVSFAKISCSIWWSSAVKGENSIPNAVRGRLGGPSQRRLSSFVTTNVLQAIASVKCVASVSRWCGQVTPESSLDSVTTFLWDFCWKIIKSPLGRSEAEAELCLAGYEALAHVLKAAMPVFSPLSLHILIDKEKSPLSIVKSEQALDPFVWTFLQNVNDLISSGELVRTRRAVLMYWKWTCLESLLSIPKFALKNGVCLRNSDYFLSGNTVGLIFGDLVESLENAGEASVLPILRSVRLMMELFASGRLGVVVSSCDGITAQMMWNLVNPCWVLHVSCNKRRVAPIAALLSSVLHSSVFSDMDMHEFEGAPGPLKWLVGKILDVGTKSPRTTRLAALHLTGLWLKYPTTIKFYLHELKLLTMYGSVAFDEDFEAELTENHEAKSEVAVLAQCPDPELTAEFINSELYARVCVAALFHKLADMADMVGSANEDENSRAALVSGKMFLLKLLQFALNDKDLSKELYKKYSAIHRRKIRVWQMICVLARFIDKENVETVTCLVHKALQTNNLPSVRQYLETFTIYIYLKFPLLVRKDLVPLLRNYDIRPQALSSYVYVAANVIMHADESINYSHLVELLPPIIPLLTSHHHTLRGFTQLLVYQILHKLTPGCDSDVSLTLSLPKRCLEELKSYLTCNPDCARLRASMEGYLDAFDPRISVTPAGIFTNRVEELDFECVPKNLMEQVIIFLNNARDSLRDSMAKDATTIRNEDLNGDDNSCHTEVSMNTGIEPSMIHLQNGMTSDFQKKFTLCKYDMQTSGRWLMGSKESLESFAGIEKEDQLLELLLHSKITESQKLRGSRQHFVLVASFIDRIPNLAGLARTCEVFRTAGLAIADKSISRDKQFQLISVTADKWVPLIEVPVNSVKVFLEKKKHEGFAILGLEQTANSIPLDQYVFPTKTVLVLGREKEGIPVEIIHVLDACIEIPQLGIVRSLNVHVSGAIAMWEYTRQQRRLY